MNTPAIPASTSVVEALAARLASAETPDPFALLALATLASGAMPSGLLSVVTKELSAQAAEIAAQRLDAHQGYLQGALDVVTTLTEEVAALEQDTSSSPKFVSRDRVGARLHVASAMMPETSPLRRAVASLIASTQVSKLESAQQVLALAQRTVATLQPTQPGSSEART